MVEAAVVDPPFLTITTGHTPPPFCLGIWSVSSQLLLPPPPTPPPPPHLRSWVLGVEPCIPPKMSTHRHHVVLCDTPCVSLVPGVQQKQQQQQRTTTTCAVYWHLASAIPALLRCATTGLPSCTDWTAAAAVLPLCACRARARARARAGSVTRAAVHVAARVQQQWSVCVCLGDAVLPLQAPPYFSTVHSAGWWPGWIHPVQRPLQRSDCFIHPPAHTRAAPPPSEAKHT